MSDVPATMTSAPAADVERRPPPEAPDEAGNYVGYRRNVWRRSWLQNVVPFATSLAVHGVLLAVAIALLLTFRDVLIAPAGVEQATVASATLATENVGATPNVGSVDDVTRQNASLNPVEQSTDFRARGEGDTANDLLTATAGGAATSSMAGVTGMGELSGALGGGGGQGSPLFGESGGGSGFMGMGTGGDGGDVKNVVFVCDATGTMFGERMALLNAELRNAIEPLSIEQSFNVVFFNRGNDFQVAFPRELKPATPRFKDEAIAFLDTVVVAGETNPMPALEAVFAMRPEPQLIFFLTDGEFNNIVSYQEVLSGIERLYQSARVKPFINTIQFIATDQQAEKVMRQISALTGGEYRQIGRDFFQRAGL